MRFKSYDNLKESMMQKKLIPSILLVAFLNLIGCQSSKSFTVSEYRQLEEKKNNPNEFRVITKDGQEYHFSASKTKFENDTLHVKGLLITSYRHSRNRDEQQVNKKIANSDIESIISKELDIGMNIVLVIGVGAIFIILASDWKPKIGY